MEPAVLAIVEAWLLDYELNLADPSQESVGASPEQLASLETALRRAGADTEVVTARDIANERPSSDTVAGVSTVLLGQATGTCFGRKPTLQTLLAAERLLSSGAAWAAFSAAAASEASSDGLKLTALVTCLRELVHAFTWAPRRIVHVHRDNMCALVDHYHLRPRIDDLWPGRHFRLMLVKHQPAFDALRQSDPASFLRLLDEFPHPEPGRHILDYSTNRMDLDGLFRLLALAPSCFDGGNWSPRIKTPFLVLAEIEAKLETLADAIEEESSVPAQAFATAVRQVVRSVIIRADGNCLGHAWLRKLIQRREFGMTRRPQDKRTCPEYALRLLLRELASALSPRLDAADWVSAEQEVWRRDRAVAAIAAAGLGETGDHDTAVALMGQLLLLRLGTTGQETGFSTSSNPERFLLGSVIGQHIMPAASFDGMWRGLVPVRDQARHTTLATRNRPSDATVIAVSWFLFGLDNIDVRTPAHRALWRSLHSAVSECAMIQVSFQAQEAWRARYCFLAAHLAYRFVTFYDDDVARDLQDFLRPILCLELTLAQVVVVLLNSGVSPAAIAAGADSPTHLAKLLRRLEAEQVWRESRQLEQLGSQSQFSREIGRAADMIQCLAPVTYTVATAESEVDSVLTSVSINH